MSYVLAVTWVARPGEEERVAEALRKMVPLTQAEPGCVNYRAHRSLDDPRRFFLFEEYVDFKRYVQGEAAPLLERRERLAYEPV